MTKAGFLSLVVLSAATLVPSIAQAHFTLDYPPAWIADSDSAGDPQKAYPCGVLSTDTYTATNMMTSFAPGAKVTLKWTEQIAHDGWFRIAISYKDGAEFQATSDFPEPQYETNSVSFSVDAGIEMPPVAPVLVDGLYPHTAASVTTPKQYTYDLTLPTMPCSKCTLQVLQIMLNHPINPPNNVPGAAYTYHHCAFISIQAGGDGGTVILPDSGGGGPTGGSGTSTGAGAGSGSGGTSSGTSAGGTGGSSGTGGAGGTGGTAGEGSSGSATGGSQAGGTGGVAGGGGGPSSGQGANGTSSDTGSKSNSSGGCSASLGSAPGVAGLSSLAMLATLAFARRKNAKK